MSVDGRVAVVTGAASGIGRATAELLAERGARVVVAGLQPDGLEETVAAITGRDGEAIAVETDIADAAAIEVLAARTAEAFGGADILVNNAAIYPIGPWHELAPERLDDIFAVNVRGYWLCSRALRPQMLERGGGAIVNVASVTFFTGEALLVGYVASKGAVIGFTRALAREAGPENIRVNAVAPGAFPTAATAIHADQEKLWSDVLAAQSLKRRGETADVARAIAFFASDDAGFVTGQTLLVDGGWMRS
jgi:NAD(P)-dependent dehydrogenase (short-subunit alcohol dehydrogenase family)